MAEKVAKIGVKREPGFLYFLRASDVWKTPMKRAGGPPAARASPSALPRLGPGRGGDPDRS